MRDLSLREGHSRLHKAALPRLFSTFANLTVSILRLLEVDGTKPRMDQLHLNPDAVTTLLPG